MPCEICDFIVDISIFEGLRDKSASKYLQDGGAEERNKEDGDVCEFGGESVVGSGKYLGHSIDVKDYVTNLEVFVCLVVDLIGYFYRHSVFYRILWQKLIS